MQFKKATKTDARLRMALMGISGSGKTMTALEVAKGLGGTTAVIDTERGSASKYADLYDFDVLELDNFSPDNYIAAVQAAEDAGYDNLIIDSFSHEWSGSGGILEIHNDAALKLKDSFRAWGGVTPRHNKVLDKILASRCHIIATMRTKSEYSVTKDNGKTSIQKIGMAPVQKDNVEYEFDVVGSLDQENRLSVEKTRCIALAGKTFAKTETKKLATVLKEWLGDNRDSRASGEILASIQALFTDLNAAGDSIKWSPATVREFLEHNYAAAALDDLGYEQKEKFEAFLKERLGDVRPMEAAA